MFTMRVIEFDFKRQLKSHITDLCALLIVGGLGVITSGIDALVNE